KDDAPEVQPPTTQATAAASARSAPPPSSHALGRRPRGRDSGWSWAEVSRMREVSMQSGSEKACLDVRNPRANCYLVDRKRKIGCVRCPAGHFGCPGGQAFPVHLADTLGVADTCAASSARSRIAMWSRS